jgi:hypothetical protein
MEIEEPQFLYTICLLGVFIPIGLFIGLAITFARRRSSESEVAQTDLGVTNPPG